MSNRETAPIQQSAAATAEKNLERRSGRVAICQMKNRAEDNPEGILVSCATCCFVISWPYTVNATVRRINKWPIPSNEPELSLDCMQPIYIRGRRAAPPPVRDDYETSEIPPILRELACLENAELPQPWHRG